MAFDSHAQHNAATVAAWQSDLEGFVLKPAEVDIELTPNGVVITSSYKFDGEVRIAY